MPALRQKGQIGQSFTSSVQGNAIRKRRALAPAGRAVAERLENRTLLTAVLTYHNDNFSDGINSTETLLTPANVNTTQFGRQFSTPVDGQVYGQPLYDPGVTITSGPLQGVHNVVYATTQHDSLYAIDAMGGNMLWHTSFLDTTNPKVNLLHATSISTVPSGDTNSGDIQPEIGITATPVIDPVNNVLYLESKTKQTVNLTTHYVHTLYKIDIGSGTILASTIIGDTAIVNGGYVYRVTDTGTGTDPYVNGTGDGSISGQGGVNFSRSRVYFNSLRQMDRPGLVMANGSLYLAFASHGDNGPYHGWVLRYDPGTLTLTGVLNTTPNGGLGGIWQGGGITAVDAQGNLYFETGNGSFNVNSSNFPTDPNTGKPQYFPKDNDYGDCFVKVTADPNSTASSQNPNGWGLKVADYFSPFDNAMLNAGDTDLGSGGLVLLPDAVGSAAHPHLLIGAGKQGKLYLIDRDHMGGFGGTDNVVQEQALVLSGSLSTPAFFLDHPTSAPPSGTLFWFPGYGGPGRAIKISNGVFTVTSTQTPDSIGYLDGTVSVSSSGVNNGIVWVIDRGSNQLRAYNAANISKELWTSAQSGHDNLVGNVVKFTVPTVADGLVMVGTDRAINVYGPPVPPTSKPNVPAGLTATAPVFNTVNLSWQDLSNNEDSFSIERSPDGQTNWQVIGQASANAITYADTTVQATTTYYYRVRAHNSFQGGSYSDYTNVAPVTTPQAPPMGTGDGLSAAYYRDTTSHLSGTPLVTRVDRVIDSNVIWNNGSPAPSIGNVLFSAKWTGTVQPQYSETYTFYTESDDGVRLFVNGQTLINDWTDHAPVEDSGTITLHEGQKYVIEMDFYQNQGGDLAQLLWSSPSTAKEIIPQSQLYSGVAPNAPSGLTGQPASSTQINLSWTDNSNNETGFALQRMAQGDASWTTIAPNLAPNTTSYMDTGLNPDVTYMYRVQALNFAGSSSYSNVFTITTPIPPAKPTNAAASAVTTNSVLLTWTDNANNEDGYRVERSTAGQDFIVIAVLPANTTSYFDNSSGKGLPVGTEFDYHVQAFNVAGYNDFTGVHTATLTVPPAGLIASGGNGQVLLNWMPPAYKAVENTMLLYNVYRGASSGAEITQVASSLTSPTFADTGVTGGQTYYYEVTAVDPGGESDFSAEASATPTAQQATVSSLSVAMGSADPVLLRTASDGVRALPAGRQNDLPFGGITRIVVDLSAPAALLAGDVALSSAAGVNYGPVTISGSGASYTVTLAKPITRADRVTITIANGVIVSYSRRIDVLPGDINDDGVVSFGDFNLMATNFGRTGVGYAGGDLNGDGKVNFADFNLLSINFDKTLPALAATPALATASPGALIAAATYSSERRTSSHGPA